MITDYHFLSFVKSIAKLRKLNSPWQLRKANRATVLLCGLIIAGIASVPILNLITPLFATAFMVRIYKQLDHAGGRGVAPRPAV